VTRQWWEKRRGSFELYISQLVVAEAERGDPDAAQRRLDTIHEFKELEIDEKVIRLTNTLLESGIFSIKAAADAGHIAVAARHGMDYLLTWNCRHIANAEIIRSLSNVISQAGYYVPVICTPLELLGADDDE
jgi:predicted nucleic acid-binding protein